MLKMNNLPFNKLSKIVEGLDVSIARMSNGFLVIARGEAFECDDAEHAAQVALEQSFDQEMLDDWHSGEFINERTQELINEFGVFHVWGNMDTLEISIQEDYSITKRKETIVNTTILPSDYGCEWDYAQQDGTAPALPEGTPYWVAS